MAKFLCLLLLAIVALVWAQDLPPIDPIPPINMCMTEFKEKCAMMHGVMKKFMQAKRECMAESCGEALEQAGYGECWTEEEAEKMEADMTALMDNFRDVVDKAAEMVVGDCPTQPPPNKIWTFEELFGKKMANHHHFKGHHCKKAFFHKFLPKESQVCLCTCILNKIKDEFPLPSMEQVQQKLDWLDDPKTALPKFMAEMDMKRAAMCIVNSCNMKILLGAVEQSGLKELLEGKRKMEKNKEIQQIMAEKCTCLRGVAEKNGVDLSGLENLDCANPMAFLKKKMVCARLVRDEAQVFKEVLEGFPPIAPPPLVDPPMVEGPPPDGPPPSK